MGGLGVHLLTVVVEVTSVPHSVAIVVWRVSRSNGELRLRWACLQLPTLVYLAALHAAQL